MKLGISLFGITFLIIACEKDNFSNEINEQSEINSQLIIKSISLDDVPLKFNNIKEKFYLERHFNNRVENSDFIQARGTSNSDFNIHTDNIKEITKSNYTSYTMYMETPDTIANNFYNIVLEDKNGTYSIFINKYVTTNDWLNNQNQNFEGQISTFRVDIPDSNGGDELQHYSDILDDFTGGSNGGGGSSSWDALNTSSIYPYDCEGSVQTTQIVEPYMCSADEHWPWSPNESNCTATTKSGWDIRTQYACIPIFNVGNPNTSWPNDTNNPNTGGGASSNDNSNVGEPDNSSISFLLGSGDTEAVDVEKSDCQSLKKLVDTDSLGSNILPYVNQLRARINLDKEWSLSYSNEWVNGKTKPVPDINGIKEGISKTRSKLDYSALWVGQIHTHPKGTFKVFSWLDLRAIKLLYENTNDYFKQDIFLMAVAPNNETYALKINDIQALITKIDNDLTNAKGTDNDIKMNNLMNAMEKEYNKSNDLEKTFLKLYGNYGIAFYKATDANLSNWERLELDDNDNVKDTNCN